VDYQPGEPGSLFYYRRGGTDYGGVLSIKEGEKDGVNFTQVRCSSKR